VSESPSFPFYANDFVGGRVATYDLAEIGAYSLLLAFDWTLNGLPKEPEKLAKLCRVSPRTFRKLWETIAEQFPERDGRRYNPRLALERAKKGVKSAGASHAAEVRWQSERNANASISHNENDATNTSVSSLPSELLEVEGALLRLVAAANKGLAEHPGSPQPIPRILHGQATALTATTAILQAGVPLAFAESQIYTLAKTHNANGVVQSLGYFRAAVIRLWEEQLARDAAEQSGVRAPEGAYRSRRKPPANAGEATYAAGRAALEDV
jgi:uncharacterized protein YdaU (DUF1376 family)